MRGKIVTLRLNQQQFELLDKTVAHGAAPDRAALVRRALREYLAAHPDGDSAGSTGSPKPQK
jgi:Arc/MetJ-type ribon-helix-helix transcriptional regulator